MLPDLCLDRLVGDDHLESLVQHAPMAIAVVDQHCRVVLWNPAAEKLLGWKKEEVLGRTAPFLPPEQFLLIKQRVVESLERGEAIVGQETERLRADGSKVLVEFSATGLRNDRGELEHIVSFMQDLEGRRAAELERLHLQKLEVVGRLAGGVAHDFNNLLTVIRSCADFALEDLPPDHPVRADVEQIQAAAERGAALTRQLLSFSRRQVAQPQPLDLAQVAEGTLQLLRRLLGEDVALETELPEGEAIVAADPGLIEQVLVNLAVNARDAMPDGGTLRISVGKVQRCQLPGERCAFLSVEDTGIGMDEETQRRIFEPFFTTKEMGKGTGLGLSTVYGIVQQAEGAIDVVSAPGRGTRFEITFPQLDLGDAIDLPPSSNILPMGEGEVLVVEDDESLRALACRILESCGYSVHTAADANAALALAAGLPRLDLVITDVVMPGMSGPALVQKLSVRRPGLRYLLMSGYTADELRRHRDAVGNLPILEKPFSPPELARRVRELLRP